MSQLVFQSRQRSERCVFNKTSKWHSEFGEQWLGPNPPYDNCQGTAYKTLSQLGCLSCILASNPSEMNYDVSGNPLNPKMLINSKSEEVPHKKNQTLPTDIACFNIPKDHADYEKIVAEFERKSGLRSISKKRHSEKTKSEQKLKTDNMMENLIEHVRNATNNEIDTAIDDSNEIITTQLGPGDLFYVPKGMNGKLNSDSRGRHIYSFLEKDEHFGNVVAAARLLLVKTGDNKGRPITPFEVGEYKNPSYSNNALQVQFVKIFQGCERAVLQVEKEIQNNERSKLKQHGHSLVFNLHMGGTDNINVARVGEDYAVGITIWKDVLKMIKEGTLIFRDTSDGKTGKTDHFGQRMRATHKWLDDSHFGKMEISP